MSVPPAEGHHQPASSDRTHVPGHAVSCSAAVTNVAAVELLEPTEDVLYGLLQERWLLIEDRVLKPRGRERAAMIADLQKPQESRRMRSHYLYQVGLLQVLL